MPRLFTNEEYADIHFIYGFANGNAEEAVREYRRRFPNRRQPDASVFINTHRQFRLVGLKSASLNEGDRQNRRHRDEILTAFDNNPRLSSRRAARQLGVSKTKILKVLHEDGRRAFHLQAVQNLLPEDAERRLNYCQWFLQNEALYPGFSRKVLWTDEATFTRRGSVNLHNLNIWSSENPHEIRSRSFQHEFSVNVWLGVIGNHVCGPHFLPARLNCQLFYNFLVNNLFELLEDVPLANRINSWIQMDGAPAHSGQIVRNWLDTNYPERWIGRLGPVSWPARAPDLNPLDFFVWGYLKDKVYATPCDTRPELVLRIQEACNELKENGHIISAAINSITRRYRKCVEVGGLHFEQLL